MSELFRDQIDRLLIDSVELKDLNLVALADRGAGTDIQIIIELQDPKNDNAVARVRDSGHFILSLSDRNGNKENIALFDIKNRQMGRFTMTFKEEDAKKIVKNRQLIEIIAYDTDRNIVGRNVVDMQSALVGLHIRRKAKPVSLKNHA